MRIILNGHSLLAISCSIVFAVSIDSFSLLKGVLTVRDDIDRESDIPSLVTNGECQAVYELTVELRDNVGGDPTETLRNQYTVSNHTI